MAPAPQLEFTLEVRVTIGAPLEVGRGPAGERRIIPITGGTFEGPALRGRVIPGGADWQTLRADGTAELDARYTLETEAGGLIYVRNRALRHGWRPGAAMDSCAYYFRTAPVFETAIPELEWMTRTIFVGSGERLEDHVSIRFWRVL